MNILSFPRNLVKRQDVMKKRRSFTLPKAWVFTHDHNFFYLKFDSRLAKRLYKPKRYKKVKVKWYG